jgi:adenosine deaminase
MPADLRPTPAQLAAMPKILLHDHLDGGLRPVTIVELADVTGYRDLPATEPLALQAWMTRGADRKDLLLYLETFTHTVGVMQTPDALARVARECVEDLADDGVIYAEVRFAPELHTAGGLALDDVVEAVLSGIEEGEAARGSAITVRALLTAMRTGTASSDVADVAVRWHGRGVVGFDLAGAEAGFPARDHRPALVRCRAAGVPLTLHAGEAFGPVSIADALDEGAVRIGHGVHLAEDIAPDGALGLVATRVLEGHVPLELCPTSNVHSGAAASIATHPIGRLHALGFAVTVNTDNRLMSACSASGEWAAVTEAFSWTWNDVAAVSALALDAAFVDDDLRSMLATRLTGWLDAER